VNTGPRYVTRDSRTGAQLSAHRSQAEAVEYARSLRTPTTTTLEGAPDPELTAAEWEAQYGPADD
jgi:hypothetical protein